MPRLSLRPAPLRTALVAAIAAALAATLGQALRAIGEPAEAEDIARRFRDGPRASRGAERGLNLLAAAGVVRRSGTGWFLPSDRAA